MHTTKPVNDNAETWKPIGPIVQNVVRRLGSKLRGKAGAHG